MEEIYLDNSATTKVCQAACQAAMTAMAVQYGNPASLHRKGFEAEQLMTKSRKSIASILGCDEQELYFTSGATESNNLALQGVAQAKKRRGNKIIISSIEHPSVENTADFLGSQGFDIVKIPPRADGKFHAVDFFDAVDDRTILVSVMLVNNETGLILPVQEIARAVKRKNKEVLVHTDAVQGFLKIPLKLKNSGIDLLSASGHKLYAPKGIGLLYMARGVKITPLFYGGGQQKGIRVGTDNPALIAAFSTACEVYQADAKAHDAHYRTLKSHLLQSVADIEAIEVNSPADSASHIVNLSVARLRSEVLLHHLETAGIYVSSGSACSKGAKSHVLTALGLPDARIDTALRISFSPETTTAQLDCLVDKITEGLAVLAKLK